MKQRVERPPAEQRGCRNIVVDTIIPLEDIDAGTTRLMPVGIRDGFLCSAPNHAPPMSLRFFLTRSPRRAIAAAILVLACGDETGSGPSASLTILDGDSGSDTVGVELPEPLVVQVRGSSLPLSGVEVIFTARRADAPESTTSPVYIRQTSKATAALVARDTTDASGRASVHVVLSNLAADGEVVVTVPTLGLEMVASFTTRPGSPVGLEVTPLDTPVVLDGSYQLTAHLVDRFSNSIEGVVSFSSSASTIEVDPDGTVHGNAIGRGRVDVRAGNFAATAFTSVVPHATLALREFGTFVGDPLGIIRVRLDGSDHRWIAQTGITPSSWGPSNLLAPRWLPNGEEVVYVADVDGVNRLFVGGAGGTHRRLIKESYPATSEFDPAVSSDGAWIYFVGTGADGQAIWRVAASGGTPERLTTPADGLTFGWPTISPDGRRIAYVARPQGWAEFRLYVRDLATGVATMISTNEAAGTVWSPTGEWILYALSGPWGGYSGQLHIIRPDGTDDRLLTGGAYYPGGTWSPDGRYVIAVSAGGGPLDLIDVATRTRLPLAFQKTWYAPAWKP